MNLYVRDTDGVELLQDLNYSSLCFDLVVVYQKSIYLFLVFMAILAIEMCHFSQIVDNFVEFLLITMRFSTHLQIVS